MISVLPIIRGRGDLLRWNGAVYRKPYWHSIIDNQARRPIINRRFDALFTSGDIDGRKVAAWGRVSTSSARRRKCVGYAQAPCWRGSRIRGRGRHGRNPLAQRLGHRCRRRVPSRRMPLGTIAFTHWKHWRKGTGGRTASNRPLGGVATPTTRFLHQRPSLGGSQEEMDCRSRPLSRVVRLARNRLGRQDGCHPQAPPPA